MYDTQFTTPDIFLAAYLVFAGYRLSRVNHVSRSTTTFIFEAASLDLADDLADFDADRGIIGAKTFGRAISYLWMCQKNAIDNLGEYRPAPFHMTVTATA